MAESSVMGIFDELCAAEATRARLAEGGLATGQISVIANSLQGTWTARGYVRTETDSERGGRYLAVVKGNAAEIAKAARILRDGGATRVDSVATLVLEFLRATLPQVVRK